MVDSGQLERGCRSTLVMSSRVDGRLISGRSGRVEGRPRLGRFESMVGLVRFGLGWVDGRVSSDRTRLKVA